MLTRAPQDAPLEQVSTLLSRLPTTTLLPGSPPTCPPRGYSPAHFTACVCAGYLASMPPTPVHLVQVHAPFLTSPPPCLAPGLLATSCTPALHHVAPPSCSSSGHILHPHQQHACQPPPVAHPACSPPVAPHACSPPVAPPACPPCGYSCMPTMWLLLPHSTCHGHKVVPSALPHLTLLPAQS